ncbi:MAG: hypothetical protein QGH45_21605 [Myxococcota bacterium]|nr:hypothetical protein [Myxococcota bacterium]
MAFRRTIRPPSRPAPDTLTRHMVGLGMNFAARPLPDANIEDTLVFASEVGMLDHDLRVLGLLVQWIGVHHAHILADRLVRVIQDHEAPRVRSFWAGVAIWLDGDRRFARMKMFHQGPRVELLPVGNAFQVERRGEDPRFREGPLIVPAGTLRECSADLLPPCELARRHAGYRNRVRMGPTWRANVWTVLEADPDIRAAEAARRAYCSFATAWQTKQDFDLLRVAS